MFKKITECYKNGLRCIVDEYYPFIIQVIYMGITIDLISVISTKTTDKLYIIILLVHIISMYILGYQKDCWELSPKEVLYQKIYFLINISLLFFVLFKTKSIISIAIILIPAIASIIIFTLISLILFVLTKNLNIEKSIKMQRISLIGIYIILMILFAIPISYMSIHIIFKIAIIISFYIFIPLIGYGADNGMNFYSLFEKSMYTGFKEWEEKQENEHNNIE